MDEILEHQRIREVLRQEVPDEWTAKSIAYIQSIDRDLAIVQNWLAEGKTPDWNSVVHHNAAVKSWWARLGQLFLSENGVLYLTWESGTAKGEPSHKVVATSPMCGPLMQSIRNSKVGAHLGQAKTVDRVKRCGFYWPGMVPYALRWVKGCRVRTRCKSPKHKRRAPPARVRGRSHC